MVTQWKQYTSHLEQGEEGTAISKRRIATEKGGGEGGARQRQKEREKNTEREEQRERQKGRGTERKSGAGREFHDMGVREGTDAVLAN